MNLKKRWVLLGILAGLSVWVAIDLFTTNKVNIRDFDPDEVARLDNAMWRSYYAKEPVRMFFQLAELLRSQYHFPFFKSNAVAFRAADAAFTFKKGSTREEYGKALPDLIHYYLFLHDVSTTSFDVNRTAELELEWWIVHRQRDQQQPGDLDTAVAKAAAEFYGIPTEKLLEYGRLRSEAMTIRDDNAKEGGVTDGDWSKIESLLHKSYRSLWQSLHN